MSRGQDRTGVVGAFAPFKIWHWLHCTRPDELSFFEGVFILTKMTKYNRENLVLKRCIFYFFGRGYMVCAHKIFLHPSCGTPGAAPGVTFTQGMHNNLSTYIVTYM